MQIKRLTKVVIGSQTFKIKWDNNRRGGYFDFGKNEIGIGLNTTDDVVFEILCHELSEAIHCVLHTRYDRTDVDSDYLFVTDHRQFTTHNAMLSGLIKQFIK